MLSELATDFAALHQAIQAALSQAIRGTPGDGPVWQRLLGLAMALGALHALTPGHGKAVLASFFLGQTASLRSAWTAGITVAAGHVGLAVALVAVFGGAVTVFGRPAGAAAMTQTFAHGVIALSGIWLLARSLLNRSGAASAPGVVPVLPAIIPCPLTMLVFSFALTRGGIGTALATVGLLGLGIALTLSGLSLAAAGLRRTVLAKWQPRPRALARIGSAAEIVSAIVIAGVGLWLLGRDLL